MTDAGLAYFEDSKNLTDFRLARPRITDAGLESGLNAYWVQTGRVTFLRRVG
jgi:hypothetical protein